MHNEVSAASSGASDFDYHRTVIAYHGTRRTTAEELVAGKPFGPSENDDDWLGHGVYFWEYAPQQAWSWAEQRYGRKDAAVVGAIIRLGSCFDLLDPANASIIRQAHVEMIEDLRALGQSAARNFNRHKFLDCAVFNFFYNEMWKKGLMFETCRAVFVPMVAGRLPRIWQSSGVFAGAHIQLCVQRKANILAVWSVRRDGRYGKDETSFESTQARAVPESP